MERLESLSILVALFSLMPVLWWHRSPWYQGWLAVVLAGMAWVAVRRLRRMREAVEEEKRKRERGA